ncbi:MAG TPA: preQ(1) synthase [Alphaproteobacteria bacterium]|nr:preQ(1) synthase [Alphaproteobacteria bacterium]
MTDTPENQDLSQLGRPTALPRRPEEAKLETFVNPNEGMDYLVRLNCPEFTCLCPITGQPDFAHFIIDYVPAKACVESKSLKLFMASWRNTGAFHEATTLTIATRLTDAMDPKWLRVSGFWYPRGGIPIDVFYQSGEPPAGLHIPDPGVPAYRPRG